MKEISRAEDERWVWETSAMMIIIPLQKHRSDPISNSVTAVSQLSYHPPHKMKLGMNRLAGLKSGGGGTASVAVAPPDSSSTFSPRETSASDDNPLETFYKDVAEVQAHISNIKQWSTDVQAKQAENLQASDQAKQKIITGEIEMLNGQITEASKACKDKLEGIQKGTAKLKETPEAEANNAGVIKIQENQHSKLIRSFLGAVQDHQKVTADNEKKVLEQTQMRIKLKYSNPDGTTIDDDRAMQLAQEALVQGTQNAIFQQSKDTLAQIIETRNDILKIEASMRELNQLFQDLAMLVTEQGEVMDIILNNVQSAVKFVEKGREELKDAKVYQKKSRKKMCWVMIVIFIIVMFVLAGVLGSSIKI